MTYAVMIEYGPDKNKIDEFRPEHRVYLKSLIDAGKLVICGPITDNTGGLIVYNVDDESEVEGIIKADPFYKCGVFHTWTIRPWKIVMANKELMP
jgi:uncharacterized protein YciI